MSLLLVEAAGAHLDAWGAALLAVALLAAVLGVMVQQNLHDHWAHHPFRMTVQGYMARGLFGAALTLVLPAAAHIAGWPIYGVPAVGALALIVAVGGIVWATVAWFTRFRPELARYDMKYPQVQEPDRDWLPEARRAQSSAPMLWGFGFAFAAYLLFVWHPWPHIFHEGNFLFGAPAGFAIGSLVAMHTARRGTPSSRSRTSSARVKRPRQRS